MNRDEALTMLRSHCAQIMEHFSSVQITACRQESEGGDRCTVRFSTGKGSWYERVGAITEWLRSQREDGGVVQQESE